MVFFSTIVSWLIQFFPNFSPALLYVGGLILFIVVSILEYKPHFSQEKEKENEKLNKAPPLSLSSWQAVQAVGLPHNQKDVLMQMKS